eukprot:scaffold8043_cov30-Tisochrysis_lutea.AAC.1
MICECIGGTWVVFVRERAVQERERGGSRASGGRREEAPGVESRGYRLELETRGKAHKRKNLFLNIPATCAA